jgi:hypothetical protein
LSDPADELASMIDVLASEYGWSQSDIMDMPIDQPPQLIHAILSRRGVRVFRKTYQTESDAPSLSERMRTILDTVTKEE